ncbi:MAG: hypothetical protein KGI54_02010 [Pseudomonadota bacterium]|nr:hypothetical protein [Pseudomonadota bacterium]
MLRFIEFIIVIWLVGRIVRQKSNRIHARGACPESWQDGSMPMVQCALCKIYVQASESVAGSLDRYCCDEHRRQAGD